MSGLNIQNSRLQQKYSTVTGATPTIAPSTDHTDGTWTENDIYVGEVYINVQDDKMWYRSLNGIIPIQSGTTTINTTTFVNKTGDTMTGPLFTPTLSANTISATTIYSPSFQGTFIGDGSQLTGITSTTFTGGTVSGPVVFTNNVDLCGAAVTVDSLSGCGGTIDVYLVINALGAISATTFYGDGSNLTNLPYFSGITLDGVLALGDTSVSGNIVLSGGSITLGSGTFYGDGSGLTNVPFGPTPTLDDVLLSGNTSTNGTIVLTNGDIILANGKYYGDGSGLSGLTDTFVTGGTYNNSAAEITFTNNYGDSFVVTGITASGGSGTQTLEQVLIAGNSAMTKNIVVSQNYGVENYRTYAGITSHQRMYVDEDGIQLWAKTDADTATSTIKALNNGKVWISGNAGLDFDISSGLFNINGYTGFAGLQYNDNYSANFTNYSLVTKQYVDGAISAATSGSSATLSQVLINGNTSGANDIQMNFGRKITSSDPTSAYQAFTPSLIRQYVVDTATTLSTTVDAEQGSWNVYTDDSTNGYQANIYSNVANPNNGLTVQSSSAYNSITQGLNNSILFIASGDTATSIKQEISQIQFTSSTQSAPSGLSGTTWFDNTFTPSNSKLTSNFRYPNPGFEDYQNTSTVEVYQNGNGPGGEDGYAQLKVEDLRSIDLGTHIAYIKTLNDGSFMTNIFTAAQDGDFSEIKQTFDTIKVTSSNSGFAGVKYAADYSANFTNRSLVDKQYVDNAIASGASGTLSTTLAAGNTTGAHNIIVDENQKIVHSAQADTFINFTADTTYTGIKKIHIEGNGEGGTAFVGVDNEGVSPIVRMASKNMFGGSANIFMVADDASIVTTTAGGTYNSGLNLSPNYIEIGVNDSATGDFSIVEQYPSTHSVGVVNGTTSRSADIALTTEAAGPAGTPSTGVKKREVNADIYTDTYNRTFLQTGTTTSETIFVSNAANSAGNTIMYTAKLFGVKTSDNTKQYVGDIKFAIGYRSGSVPTLIGSPIITHFTTLNALSIPSVSVDSTSVYIKVRNNEGAQVEWSILVEECVHSKINI